MSPLGDPTLPLFPGSPDYTDHDCDRLQFAVKIMIVTDCSPDGEKAISILVRAPSTIMEREAHSHGRGHL